MPTTEDLIAHAKEVADKNKKLEADLKSMQAKLESTPNTSGMVLDSQGRVRGYFEESDEENIEIVSGYNDTRAPRAQPVVKARTASRQGMKALLKHGYVPRAQYKSLNEFIRDGLDNHKTAEFAERHRKAFGSALKAIQGMSEAIGSDGGFTVMPEYAPKIFERVYDNDLVSQCDQYTVAGNNMTFVANAETSRVDGSRHGGLRGYWTGEGNTITSSKPTVRQIQMKLQKCAVVVYLTDELIADSGQALEQYVTREAADEKDHAAPR